MKTQHRAICAIAALAIAVPLVSAAPSGAGNHSGSPGAPGVGDPYFPLDGDGGYDTRHYDLDLGYNPTTGVLKGRARIEARSTQRLSSFNLDLVGMNVRHVEGGTELPCQIRGCRPGPRRWSTTPSRSNPETRWRSPEG